MAVLIVVLRKTIMILQVQFLRIVLNSKMKTTDISRKVSLFLFLQSASLGRYQGSSN